jgi:hypothetical protein
MFVTSFARACLPSVPVLIKILDLPSGLLLSGFFTKTLHTLVFSPVLATCPTHLRIFDLKGDCYILHYFTLTKPVEEIRSCKGTSGLASQRIPGFYAAQIFIIVFRINLLSVLFRSRMKPLAASQSVSLTSILIRSFLLQFKRFTSVSFPFKISEWQLVWISFFI